MRDFRDAKAMAQTLRDTLKTKSITLSHSESLELVAKSFGLHDWNVLAARIEAIQPAGTRQPATPFLSAGTVIPVIPLRDIVLFPQMVAPIFVGRDKTKLAVANARANGGLLFAVKQRRSGDDDPVLGDLHSVGVTMSVIENIPLNDNKTIKMIVIGRQRASIVKLVGGEFLSAEIAPVEDANFDLTANILTLSRQVLEAYEAYAHGASRRFQSYLTDPGMLADNIAPLLQMLIGAERMQAILEADNVVKRLETILELMKAGRQAA